jgi:SAM-dependent methyltransferase
MNNLISINCAICGSIQPFSVMYAANFDPSSFSTEVFSARRRPDGLHYRIVRCDRCGLVFSNPIVDQKALVKLYQESKFTYEKELSGLRKTYARYLKRFAGHYPAKSSLMEIGCGNGFFLEEAMKFGFANVCGVEPSEHAVSLAPDSIRKHIIADVFSDGLFPYESFDVICVFQTFDHLTDPNGFLELCRKYLKENGALVFLNHNVEAASAKILGERSPIIDIEHIYLYSPLTHAAILKKHGFAVAEACSARNTAALAYWLQLFPLPEKIKNSISELLNFFSIGRAPVTLPVGNMAICAVKR